MTTFLSAQASGAAAPTGLAQPRARKARTTTPTEKKEESK